MKNTIETIATRDVPASRGHYSQAVIHAETIYISGQLPVPPSGEHRPEARFEEQVRVAVSNLLGVLAASGADSSDLLKVTAYIVGIERSPTFNAIDAELMGAGRPARSVVPVPALHHGYLVEIDAIARRPGRSAPNQLQ
jgi:reactive intermediate/imine deaminase